jgi:diguanylate cyclase (GGDEF)-like protein
LAHADQPPFAVHAITDAEIARRRDLFGIDEEVVKTLRGCRDLIEPRLADVVDAFYRHQLTIPEVAAQIGDEETLARLHPAQCAYVLDLFGGCCDRAYVERRLRVGQVHEHLGVSPELYMAAMITLREKIEAQLLHRITGPERRATVHRALGRLLVFDASLAMDTYFGSLLGKVEQQRGELASYAQDLERRVVRRTRQLEERTRRDPLTDLYNPRAMRELLRREMARARRRQRSVALIYFDVDDFKRINDTLGHQAGDKVLQAVGRVLRRACREIDVPCRYGGDEFCVVVSEADLEVAQTLCRRIITAFAREYADVTFSLGIALTGPEEFCKPDELIARADRLMYEAKKEPGFQIRF